jgi:hypothetical protein
MQFLCSKSSQPGSRTNSCPTARRKACGDQISAGRCFPIDHFSGHKHARQVFQHKVLVKRTEANTSRATNGLFDRPCGTHGDRQSLNYFGKFGRISNFLAVGRFVQQRPLQRIISQAVLQVREIVREPRGRESSLVTRARLRSGSRSMKNVASPRALIYSRSRFENE